MESENLFVPNVFSFLVKARVNDVVLHFVINHSDSLFVQTFRLLHEQTLHG